MGKSIVLVSVTALFVALSTMAFATETGTRSMQPVTDVQQNMTSQVKVLTNRFEFRKKKWNCLCQMMADADGTHKGTWEGRVESRLPRIGVEKSKANNTCENATAQHGVDCKKCSCRLEKPAGEKPRGIQVKKAK
jgi:hypothetical protein